MILFFVFIEYKFCLLACWKSQIFCAFLISPEGNSVTSHQGIAVFTICFSNYIAQADVLAQSLAAQHPGLSLTVFVMDPENNVGTRPALARLLPAETLFTRQEWNHRRCRYSVVELSTSIKPACFRHLLDAGARMAIYLDPDIRLFAPLDFLWREGAASLTLRPHILSPLPQDECRPADLNILQAGLYNLGFAALRNTPQSLALLDWWDSQLHSMCLEDVREGVFTDQKWMDFAPLFVADTLILRHAGCNVAYWNLHERTPLRQDDRWRVRGPDGAMDDLVFFHFSGFSAQDSRLSHHESRFGRTPPGDTAVLLAGYAQALLAAGYAGLSRRKPEPPRFADGVAWDEICRSLYRQAQAEDVPVGDPLEDTAFLTWAAGSAEGDRASRYLRAVLRLRPDVAEAFADGLDQAGLEAWLNGQGRRDMGLDPALLQRLGAVRAAVPPAVHVVGYLRAHLGVGEAVRNSIAALRRAGVAVVPHDVSGQTDSPLGSYPATATATAMAGGAAPRLALIACNADALPSLLPALPPAVREAYRIGCWYWEAPEFPEAWCDRFELVDEVWATTEFIAAALRGKATVPVAVVPPMVAPPPMAADRAWLAGLVDGLRQDEFTFLFQFDAASVPFRKNPEGTIAAFRMAFRPTEPVRLVIKLLNGSQAPGLLARLEQMAAGHRISFLDQPLESLDRFRLLASVDSFVSLHRAEGLGLSILEAMAYGLPVVTTAWSGNMDFTTETNAALVGFDLRPTTEPHGPYPAGTNWAEPRLDDAAQQMRRVWAEPAWRQALGRAAAATIAQSCSPEAAGKVMRERLERLLASERIRARTSSGAVLAKAAPSRQGLGWRLLRIAGDAWRHPGYYLSRLPRVPALLMRHGLQGVLYRAGMVAGSTSAIKRQYRLGGVWVNGVLPWLRRRLAALQPAARRRVVARLDRG